MALPISSKYRSRPNDPVPDQERQQLSSQLNDAFASGDLSQEQFDAHLDTIFHAKTLGELVPVVETLGKPPTHAVPEIVQQNTDLAPGEVGEITPPSGKTQLAVVGGLVGAGLLLVIIVVLALML